MAARARSGGISTGVGVALVLMALLTVASTTLAIVANLQIEEHRQERQRAESERDRVISDRDRDNPEIARYWNRSDTTNTVARQLLTEVQNWRTLVGAPADQDYRSFGLRLRDITFTAEDRERTLGDPQYETREGEDVFVAARRELIEDFRLLRDEARALRQRVVRLEAEFEEEREALEAAIREREQVSREFEQAKAEADEKIQDLEQAYETDRGRWREQYEGVRAALRSMQQEFNEFREQVDERDTSAIVTELRQRILEREREIRELRERLGQRPPVATPTAPLRPDAQVVRRLDDHHVVIDVGRAHGVPMGLTFEVFDADEPMPDRAGEGRGKGSVEVIRLEDQSAVAQITRRDDDARIGVGDMLFNVIFDRDRRYNFFVHGNFDIGERGRATAADRRRVETLVRNFRGRLMNELDYQVDYVVLGVRPDRPELPEFPDEFARAEHERLMEAYEDYHDIEDQARERGIPVLSQNRFLNLIGYYTR